MIQLNGTQFTDEFGRRLMLRGVNLGGSSKVPYQPNGATYIREGFFDHRAVSFVGRPFPLAEADEHFRRLKHWGLTFLRFLVTWEAVEHAGPGIYDEEYLDYLRALLKKAGEYDISLFIDPHQDVWSRLSGGDGAPGWTLEAVGLDPTHFAESGAAIVHATHGDPFPKMVWYTNGIKLAAATMFTLFFGGNDFASATTVNGEPVQEFLQRHYIESIRQVALRLADLSNVVGYDTLNEPLSGYIGLSDIGAPLAFPVLGVDPSPYQGMLLGAGIPQTVPAWKMGLANVKPDGTRRLNEGGVRAWKDGHECVWRQNGVWDMDGHGQPCLLRPDHFAQVGGCPVDFVQDYYRPFANRFAAAIRQADPRALIFIESEAGKRPPKWCQEDADRVVFAPHWYDTFVLVKKEFSPLIAVDFFTHRVLLGPSAIRRSFARQLDSLKCLGCSEMGDAPTLVAEFGIPFDINDKRAFRTGDYRAQSQALERNFQAMEANRLSCTLWNYTADNDHAHGDQWNDEDLSIFCREEQADPADIDSGGRALDAVVRPYPRATAGELLRVSFDSRTGEFSLIFRHDPHISAPTEIFLPTHQYPRGCRVAVSDGTYELDREAQTLVYHHTQSVAEHSLHVSRV